jgi:hypothetical protein
MVSGRLKLRAGCVETDGLRRHVHIDGSDLAIEDAMRLFPIDVAFPRGRGTLATQLAPGPATEAALHLIR